jgi:hypothetical protein
VRAWIGHSSSDTSMKSTLPAFQTSFSVVKALVLGHAITNTCALLFDPFF